MSLIGQLKSAWAGTLGLLSGADPSVRRALINQALDIYADFNKAADDGMASTTTADTKFYTNPYDFDLYVTGLKYNATGTITADDNNFATCAVKTDDGAGGATATAVSFTTKTVAMGGVGNVASGVSVSGSLSNAATRLRPGASLYFNIAKGGTGVVVRAGMYAVRLQKGE